MKNLIILPILIFCLSFTFGCGSKTETREGDEESLSIEVEPIFVSEMAASLPPPGPYKPTAEQIQTALKKAGFYTGKIDGKIGPISDKAIKDFQAANKLKVDGKVGPKTWEKLKFYLGSSQ